MKNNIITILFLYFSFSSVALESQDQAFQKFMSFNLENLPSLINALEEYQDNEAAKVVLSFIKGANFAERFKRFEDLPNKDAQIKAFMLNFGPENGLADEVLLNLAKLINAPEQLENLLGCFKEGSPWSQHRLFATVLWLLGVGFDSRSIEQCQKDEILSLFFRKEFLSSPYSFEEFKNFPLEEIWKTIFESYLRGPKDKKTLVIGCGKLYSESPFSCACTSLNGHRDELTVDYSPTVFPNIVASVTDPKVWTLIDDESFDLVVEESNAIIDATGKGLLEEEEILRHVYRVLKRGGKFQDPRLVSPDLKDLLERIGFSNFDFEAKSATK